MKALKKIIIHLQLWIDILTLEVECILGVSIFRNVLNINWP
jgi:hypothetical protein